MKKRGLLTSIWFLVVLLTLFSSHSLELSDSWYASFDTLVIDDVLYEVAIDSEGETAFLTSESESLVHYINLYSTLQLGDYELQFASREYVTDEINSSDTYYRANLILSLLEPIILVNITLNEDGVYLGEEYEFEVFIENNGTAPISQVRFMYTFDDLFTISSPTNCDYTQTMIDFIIDLDEGDSYSCRYTLIPFKPFSGNIVGEVVYETETVVRNFASVTVGVVEPITVDVTLFDELINTSSDSNITFDFKHNATSDVDFRFRMYVPDDLEDVSLPRSFDEIDLENPLYGYVAYEYEQSFSEDEEKNYAMFFRPEFSKDITFFYEYFYEYKNHDFLSDISTINIQVEDEYIDDDEFINYSQLFNVTINISTDDQMYTLQSDDILIDFKNRLRDNITNVSVVVNIDNQTHLDYFYPLITRALRTRLPPYLYTAPFVTTSKDLTLAVNISYTYNKTSYSAVTTQSFTVLPLPIASVTKTIADAQIAVSESTIVSVKADYDGESRSFPYTFTEVIPDGFIVNGVTKRTLRLIGEDEELDIYDYEIIAKDVDNITDYELVTMAYSAVEGQNQTFILNQSISVSVTPYLDGITLSSATPKDELGVGEILPVTLFIGQNGTTPIYNLSIYPQRNYDADVSYKTLVFEQLNPGDEREYSYDIRFTGNESNISSIVSYSYYTPKGVRIVRNYTVFEYTLLTNSTRTYGPKGVMYANQTEYGSFNTTVLTASRSYDNLTIFSNGFSYPITQTVTIINNTGSSLYATYDYLGRTFELAVPVSTQVYVDPVQINTTESISTPVVEQSNVTESDDDSVNSSLSPIQIGLIGAGLLLLLALLGFIAREVLLRKSSSSILKTFSQKDSSSLVKPNMKDTDSVKKRTSLFEKMSSIKKGSDSSEKKKEFVKIKPVESSPKIEPIVEPKRDEKSQIKMPDEKSSSYSVSEQLKQSRNLLNQLKK